MSIELVERLRAYSRGRFYLDERNFFAATADHIEELETQVANDEILCAAADARGDSWRAIADRQDAVLAQLDTDNFLHLADGHDTLHDQHGEQVFWTGGEGASVVLVASECTGPGSVLDAIDEARAAYRAAVHESDETRER